MIGLDEDNILNLLTQDTIVMHDHNRVNYNEKYSFRNIECNQHLQRDCQKNSDDTGHSWLLDLKELISSTIKIRQEVIASGKQEFEEWKKEDFYKELEKC